jgi:hypothetical protein
MSVLVGTNVDGVPMRHRWAAVRDTIIVLGLQLIFRATMILRCWNY